MDLTAKRMMALIRSEICGAEVSPSLCDGMTEQDWAALEAFSRRHDLSHLVGNAAVRLSLLPEGETKERFKKAAMLAMMRYQRLECDLARLREALSGAAIPFLPLKGSVLRHLYPTPWLRTSCDVDLLVRTEDLERAIALTQETLGGTVKVCTEHDVSVFTAGGGHIELHHTLVEEDDIGAAALLLKKAWDYAEPTGTGSEYRFCDAMFCYYHLAHMAKHIVFGGCGVRPFVDLWILNHRAAFDAPARQALLEAGGLSAFADAANALCEEWFGDTPESESDGPLGSFVLAGGVYGSRENYITVRQAKEKGGKLGFLWHRIWLPYSALCVKYPSLAGKRLLQPIYEVRRWLGLLRPQAWRRSVAEAKISNAVTADAVREKKELLASLHLQ